MCYKPEAGRSRAYVLSELGNFQNGQDSFRLLFRSEAEESDLVHVGRCLRCLNLVVLSLPHACLNMTSVIIAYVIGQHITSIGEQTLQYKI